MASRLFKQFLYSFNPMLTMIEGSFQIGTGGNVIANSVVGQGMAASSTLAVQQKGGGIYQVTLQDDYYRLVSLNTTIMPPLASRAVPDGSSAVLVVGKAYQIIDPSTSTNWYTLGLPVGLTPTSGMPFVATSGASNTPGSSAAQVGSGTMALIGTPNINSVSVLPQINLELSPTSGITFFPTSAGGGNMINYTAPVSAPGSYIWLQTYNSSSGQPVAPTSGTIIRYQLFLRNSSQLLAGEQPGNS